MSNASSTRSTSGWTDWISFAGVILLLSGTFGVIQGLSALIGPDAYYADINGSLLIFDVTGWGWWNIVTGVVAFLTGLALLSGALWARIIAVILAGMNSIVQMILVPVQPWWSFIIIAIDFFIIYAILAHGKEMRSGD